MEIKGTAIRSTLAGLRAVGGSEGLRRVMDALPEDVREELDRILPGAWYPVRTQAEVHLAIQRTIGRGAVVLNHRVGQAAADIDFKGVYRAVIWMVGCTNLVKRSTRTWSQYNSRGRILIDTLDRGATSLRVVDTSGYNEAMWNAVAGRFQGGLVVAGARAAHASVIACSPTQCTFEIGWAEG